MHFSALGFCADSETIQKIPLRLDVALLQNQEINSQKREDVCPLSKKI